MNRTQKKVYNLLNSQYLKGITSDTLLPLSETIHELYQDLLDSKDEEIRDLRASSPKYDEKLAEELYEVYPMYLSQEINGLKAVAKGLGSHKIQDLFNQYCKDIENDPEKHQEIIENIKWADKNKLIKFSFSNFVLSKDYVRIATERIKKSPTFTTDLI